VSISNDQIYDALLGVKQDIGGLKATADLHLKAIENFGPRIGALEMTAAKQKGAARVWALVATGLGTVVGAVASYFGSHYGR
jgi:hypothetical protein